MFKLCQIKFYYKYICQNSPEYLLGLNLPENVKDTTLEISMT